MESDHRLEGSASGAAAAALDEETQPTAAIAAARGAEASEASNSALRGSTHTSAGASETMFTKLHAEQPARKVAEACAGAVAGIRLSSLDDASSTRVEAGP